MSDNISRIEARLKRFGTFSSMDADDLMAAYRKMEAERNDAYRAVADLARVNRLIVRGKLVVPAATVHNKHIAVIEAARKMGDE